MLICSRLDTLKILMIICNTNFQYFQHPEEKELVLKDIKVISEETVTIEQQGKTATSSDPEKI